MATVLGVSPQTYSRFEKGEQEPKLDQWDLMARTLDVPVEELLRPDLLVININNSKMVSNSGSQHYEENSIELLKKFIDQFEARVVAVERMNLKFMEMVEVLVRDRNK
jgi:DNA-binding XRE family transcriptional regulator